MLTSIRRNALTLALAAACASMPAAAEDLFQIYQQARQADPTLAIADSTKGAVGEGVDQARSALLPQISASLGYLHDDGSSNSVQPVSGPDSNLVLLPVNSEFRNRSRAAQGVINQSLFNWGNITRLRGAHETADASGSDYEAARRIFSCAPQRLISAC